MVEFILHLTIKTPTGERMASKKTSLPVLPDRGEPICIGGEIDSPAFVVTTRIFHLKDSLPQLMAERTFSDDSITKTLVADGWKLGPRDPRS